MKAMDRIVAAMVCVLGLMSGNAVAEISRPTIAPGTDGELAAPRSFSEVQNWYAGGAIGVSLLTGWEYTSGYNPNLSNYSEDSSSQGSFDLIGMLSDAPKTLYRRTSFEGKIYGGYRVLDFMDLEMGYTRNDNWNPTQEYTRNSTGETVKIEHRIRAQAMYASLSLRPNVEGKWHGLYCKLGRHYSKLKVSNSVTGSAANLAAIAAAENPPYDGNYSGYGMLYAIGYDFTRFRQGAVRLELSKFGRLAGTTLGKVSVSLGLHANF